jgi:hypothetical protein
MLKLTGRLLGEWMDRHPDNREDWRPWAFPRRLQPPRQTRDAVELRYIRKLDRGHEALDHHGA